MAKQPEYLIVCESHERLDVAISVCAQRVSGYLRSGGWLLQGGVSVVYCAEAKKALVSQALYSPRLIDRGYR